MQKIRMLSLMTNSELLNWEQECKERLDFYQRVIPDNQLARDSAAYIRDVAEEKAKRQL